MSVTDYNETYRGQFHFSARENWINDPNGLVFYKGQYHLFFQHNPFGIQWGNMTWGHAISNDLVHWQQVEHALLPDELGTMFSGSAVVDWENTAGFQTTDDKVIVLMYTAAGSTSPESQGKPFTQCLAYSCDGGSTFTKYTGNPVLPHIVKENRDPKVIWHAPTHRWVMVLYLDGNTYGFFASSDLKHWDHLHDIDMPECSECPDFFPIRDDGDAAQQHWVFTAANGRYFVGSFDGNRFISYTALPLQVDFGANYYAVQTYSDLPDQRCIQMSWMAGGVFPDMPFNHQMSFPCELRLITTASGLRLTRQPVSNIATLYTEPQQSRQFGITDSPRVISTSDAMELMIECDVSDQAELNLVIRGEALRFSVGDSVISCLGKSAQITPIMGRISLRILLDRASIEVFANGGLLSMTSCFTPDPANKVTTISGCGVYCQSLIAYTLKSAWVR